eukprot:jgi/Mesvir1/22039/Mv25114-RA.1
MIINIMISTVGSDAVRTVAIEDASPYPPPLPAGATNSSALRITYTVEVNSTSQAEAVVTEINLGVRNGSIAAAFQEELPAMYGFFFSYTIVFPRSSAPPPPPPPGGTVPSSVCTSRGCSPFQLYKGPWGPCSTACGDGTAHRAVFCKDALGRAAEPLLCLAGSTSMGTTSLALLPLDTATCRPGACWAATVSLGPWSNCSAECGGDGVATRDATCGPISGSSESSGDSGSSASPTPEEQAACDAILAPGASPKVYRSVPCNVAPCAGQGIYLGGASYAWEVDSWSSCATRVGTGCGGGFFTRKARCRRSDGAVVKAKYCSSLPMIGATGSGSNATVVTSPATGVPLFLPPTTRGECNTRRCFHTCALRLRVRGGECSGEGPCADGVCFCPAGRRGTFCDAPSSCASSRVDRNGACCPSGVVSLTGVCCAAATAPGSPPPTLDRAGACCTLGVLDACGVCGGKGVAVDVAGRCCAGALDEGGHCCQGPSIADSSIIPGSDGEASAEDEPGSTAAAAYGLDECNVCGGRDACPTEGVVAVGVPLASATSLTRFSETGSRTPAQEAFAAWVRQTLFTLLLPGPDAPLLDIRVGRTLLVSDCSRVQYDRVNGWRLRPKGEGQGPYGLASWDPCGAEVNRTLSAGGMGAVYTVFRVVYSDLARQVSAQTVANVREALATSSASARSLLPTTMVHKDAAGSTAVGGHGELEADAAVVGTEGTQSYPPPPLGSSSTFPFSSSSSSSSLSSPSNMPAPTPAPARRRLLQEGEPFTLLGLAGDVRKSGVCGNGVCEAGESCVGTRDSSTSALSLELFPPGTSGLSATGCCPGDCPFVLRSCPTGVGSGDAPCSGRGVCHAGSGVCTCFEGHAGEACEVCAVGWSPARPTSGSSSSSSSSSGEEEAAAFSAGFLCSREMAVPLPGEPGYMSIAGGSDGDDDGFWRLWVIIVIACAGGLLLCCCCTCCLCLLARRRRRRDSTRPLQTTLIGDTMMNPVFISQADPEELYSPRRRGIRALPLPPPAIETTSSGVVRESDISLGHFSPSHPIMAVSQPGWSAVARSYPSSRGPIQTVASPKAVRPLTSKEAVLRGSPATLQRSRSLKRREEERRRRSGSEGSGGSGSMRGWTGPIGGEVSGGGDPQGSRHTDRGRHRERVIGREWHGNPSYDEADPTSLTKTR